MSAFDYNGAVYRRNWQPYHQRRRYYFFPQDATVEQEGFRWRNDDGTEATASWKASQDTNGLTVARAERVRLRAILDATGDPLPDGAKLQYRRTGTTTWHDVSEQ